MSLGCEGRAEATGIEETASPRRLSREISKWLTEGKDLMLSVRSDSMVHFAQGRSQILQKED